MSDTAVPIALKAKERPKGPLVPRLRRLRNLAAVQSFLPELGIPKENICFVSGIAFRPDSCTTNETYGMHSIHGVHQQSPPET